MKRVVTFIIIAVACLIAFLVWSNHQYKESNEKLLRAAIVKEAVVTQLNKNAEQQEQSIKIDERVVNKVVRDIKAGDKADLVIRTQLDRKIREIKGQIPTPVSKNNVIIVRKSESSKSASEAVDNHEQLDREISKARIESLWEHYCLTAPDDSDCIKPIALQEVKQ